ncbi:HDOD domain-containing protein [Andreprevotia chitinilytica]|uniref:HDOD domain-containing protein n=1 Tax=Andreprevotia chitinilytica TaxID=396808 RepID=UPI00055977D2|nr:HDOD domain-containing protein [Andreprevotia chitinilytica]
MTDPVIPDTSPDKHADQLNKQRFSMLEDIASELSGEVIFPICFDSAIQIGTVMRSPNASLRQIADVVRTDPLVATKLLRLANTVAYNPAGQNVTDVEKAIARLGMATTRSTALACAMEQLVRSGRLVVFEEISNSMWQHSLKTAAAASVFARKLTRISPDTAMLAGLIHDLGAFYMLDRAGNYPELVARPKSVVYLIAQWHESIGNMLMDALGLPEEVVEAVREHDQPCAPIHELRTLKDIVYVANLFAGGLEEVEHLDLGEVPERPELSNPAFVALESDIEALYHELSRAL